jgi:hypothetical protein
LAYIDAAERTATAPPAAEPAKTTPADPTSPTTVVVTDEVTNDEASAAAVVTASAEETAEPKTDSAEEADETEEADAEAKSEAKPKAKPKRGGKTKAANTTGKKAKSTQRDERDADNDSDDDADEPSEAAGDDQETSKFLRSLETAAKQLERDTANPPTSHEQISQHATLRLVYLLMGKRDEALAPIPGIPAAQQDFWSKELYGLAALLDAERNPDASRRAAEANAHLRDATVRLGEAAMLQVRNAAFCTEVSSYGVYQAFETAEFQPGQEVLLYAEVENFKTAATDQGYHTALKASYQILDERGARVEEKEFALTEEYCQNPRRDFFLRYFIWMPQKIYGGSYKLQFSIEDTLGHKIGQATVPFKIKGA